MGLKVKVAGVWVPATAPTGAPDGMVTSSDPTPGDNELVRYDSASGQLIQGSPVVVDDTGDLWTDGSVNAGGGVYSNGEAVWSDGSTAVPDARYLQLTDTGSPKSVYGQVSFEDDVQFVTGSVYGLTKSDVGLENVANLAQVDLTNAQTIGGVKTFSSTPVVPDGSFGVAKLSATGRTTTTFLRGDNTWATPTAAAPSNMVTTDTGQVLTTAGIKQFPPGTLLMRNAAGTATAEPYSDVNPPATLQMSDQAATPATPPAGQSTLYTPDGKTLRLRDDDGTEVLVGPSAGGGGTSGADFSYTTEYLNTIPSTPASGLKTFARTRARNLLASVGPQGQDTIYQPAFFSNRIARLTVVSGVATPVADGLATGAYAGAPALVLPASTSFFTGMVRARYSSTATAGTWGGVRSNTTQWFMSSTANLGGFFFVCRFGLAVITTTNRVFVGMRTATASATAATEPAIPNATLPSALTNMMGFACDSTETTFQFIHKGPSGTATKIDLGANFPAQTAATNFYEARIFVPSGGGQQVRWSMTRLNDGVVASGTATTNLPALGTMLAAHVVHSNGTTGSIASLDLQSMYIESDN